MNNLIYSTLYKLFNSSVETRLKLKEILTKAVKFVLLFKIY